MFLYSVDRIVFMQPQAYFTTDKDMKELSDLAHKQTLLTLAELQRLDFCERCGVEFDPVQTSEHKNH